MSGPVIAARAITNAAMQSLFAAGTNIVDSDRAARDGNLLGALGAMSAAIPLLESALAAAKTLSVVLETEKKAGR